MANYLLILPILIPLVTAIVMLAMWRRLRLQRRLSLYSMAALLAVTILLFQQVWVQGVQSVAIGNWSAPFGIVLVADLLSAVMAVVVALVGLAVASYATVTMDSEHERGGYHPLFQILMMALSGAVLTGDLFNLFVWFEVMLITSFVLLAMAGGRDQIEGAFKYVTLNLLASSLFLAAIGILYGATGTLNLADLALYFRQGTISPQLTTTLAMLFLVAFGIKSAIFPLFFWLPASYHTAPPVISALFAGLLTKVGIYVLLRTFTLLFVLDVAFTHTLLLWLAGLTMVVGVLGAAAQNEIRRILSFHIVSQIGYMIMGLALLTPLALTGAIFFLVHNIVVKTNLFLIGGLIHRLQGTEKLKWLGGLYQSQGWIAFFFLISALALAGLPPFSGFWAKLLLVQAGLTAESYWIVAVALGVSMLTLYSMTKIWNEVFWKDGEAEQRAEREQPPLLSTNRIMLVAPIALFTIVAVGMGIWAEPMVQVAELASAQLLDPTHYINAVLTVEPALAEGR